MRLAPGLVMTALCALAPGIAAAQPYPGVTPVPRTTDAAKLHAIAVQREIVERIHLGVEAEARQDWATAADEFERVLALHPREPQGSTAYYDLGIAQVGLQRLDEAAASFDKAIGLDSGFLAARANLVTVQLLRGDLAAARKSADELVAAAPDSARALYARGLVALKSGDASAALGDFRKLLERNPSYAIAHYNLGLAEVKLGRLDDAERELRDALGLSPEYARARLALGSVLLLQGKRAEARAAFDDAARDSQDVALRTVAQSLRDAIAHQ